MALQTESITDDGSKGHHKFTLTITENSIDEDNNTSNITYTLKISPIQTGYDWNSWGNSIRYTITIDSVVVASGNIPAYDGTSTTTIATNSLNIAHNEDGNKTLTFSFNITDNTGVSYTCGTASASGSMTLTEIIQGILRLGITGVWKKANVYLGVNGVWKKCRAYIGINGSWKKGV